MKQILFFVLCISLASGAFAETDTDKNAQLIQAAKDNNSAAVQTLLAGGADINAKRSTDGTTSLMWAALNGNTEIVKLLLEKGADVNATSNSGLTALAAARSNGHKDIVQMLDKTAAPDKDAQPTQPAKDSNAPAVQTENKTEKPAANELISSSNITFKSAEKAPKNFDAWRFEGMTPIGDANQAFSFTAVGPDGQESGWRELVKSKNRYFRIFFKPGSPGGDARVFYNEFVVLKIRADKGNVVFKQSDLDSFKFQFCRKTAAGEINWDPFKVIDAVIEP